MSISVKNITKVYGSQKALDNVSFEVEKGSIVGLLGPNGAGKSTMMKILTGFIPPNEGEAAVCGFDVQEQPLEVKKRVGYLPEHNPLYLDMYVKEYLGFIADIYKLGKQKNSRVEEMIHLTGLTPESKKKIGALSKGYRQRVGLAQAMIHDPEILILDEPTSGLDPNQLVDIRNLIKNVGKDKTVILSTHIMQEVEAMCQKVIIINKGNIVANDDTALLSKHTTSSALIFVEFAENVAPNQLRQIAKVNKVQHIKENSFVLESNVDVDIRQDVFQFAVQNNLNVLSLRREEKNLEEMFHELTKNKK